MEVSHYIFGKNYVFLRVVLWSIIIPSKGICAMQGPESYFEMEVFGRLSSWSPFL